MGMLKFYAMGTYEIPTMNTEHRGHFNSIQHNSLDATQPLPHQLPLSSFSYKAYLN